MEHQIVSSKAIRDTNEVIAYLERVLEEGLRAAGADNRVHLWCIDAGADTLSDKFCELGGSPREMGEEAIVCFEKAGEHRAGVVMTAGDRRISVKASPDGYRITISLLPPPEDNDAPTLDSGATDAPAVTDVTEQGPESLPRPPGLSSGVPSGVFHDGDQHDSD